MVQSDALSRRPDFTPEEDTDNENITMLPDELFVNLIDAELGCYGGLENITGRRTDDHSESTPGLDSGTDWGKTSPLLPREKLHPQGRRTTKGYSEDVS